MLYKLHPWYCNTLSYGLISFWEKFSAFSSALVNLYNSALFCSTFLLGGQRQHAMKNLPDTSTYMTSSGNQIPDLLILSSVSYPLGHMFPFFKLKVLYKICYNKTSLYLDPEAVLTALFTSLREGLLSGNWSQQLFIRFCTSGEHSFWSIVGRNGGSVLVFTWLMISVKTQHWSVKEMKRTFPNFCQVFLRVDCTMQQWLSPSLWWL